MQLKHLQRMLLQRQQRLNRLISAGLSGLLGPAFFYRKSTGPLYKMLALRRKVLTDSYAYFKQRVLGLTGIDLNYYREEQMKRRIDALIRKNKCFSYDSFIELLVADKNKFDEFVNYLTINVSEFWRNPDQWRILENDVIPEFRKKIHINIWSAACSTGDEPYSLAMLMLKYYSPEKFSILATDIDKQVLKTAEAGIYDNRSLKGLPADISCGYLEKLPDGRLRICDKVRSCVTFKQQNLLNSFYPGNMDLIVCRNVLIYFTEEAKNKICRGFNNSLNKDGVLFIGSTEQIMYPEKIGFKQTSSFFYKKM